MARHKQQFVVLFGYDGRRFHGVAPQPGVATAGAALFARLRTATEQTPRAVSFAARTDAGVAAVENLASFRLEHPFDPQGVLDALQCAQPDGLVAVTPRLWPSRAMARNMTTHKHYCYRLAGPHTQVHAASQVWQLAVPFCATRLRRALAHFVGTHDFSNFCLGGQPVGQPIKTITRILVAQQDPQAPVEVHIHGDNFLRRMVRMLVFTAMQAALGMRSISSLGALLRPAGQTANIGPRISAPACGLTLMALTLTPQEQARWQSQVLPPT